MKQQYDNISTDSRDIRAALAKTDFPPSLSSEAIEDLVAGVPQKKSKKKTVKKAIAGVLAACVALCGLFALDAAVYAPVIKPAPDGKPGYTQDYSKILAIIRDYRKSERFKNKIRSYSYAFMYGAYDEKSADAAMPGDTDGSSQESTSVGSAYNDAFSQTNTRVAGIGEADIVKTDGKNLYVVRGETVFILKILDGGRVEKLAELSPLDGIADEEKNEPVSDGDISLYGNEVLDMAYGCCVSGNYRSVNGIYVSDGRLCVGMSCIRNGKRQTGIAIYDISGGSAPVLKKVFMQDGAGVSSRAVGDSFILVSQSVVYDSASIDDSVIPEVAAGGTDGLKSEKISAGSIAVADADSPTGFLIVSKIDTKDLTSEPSTTALLGGGTDIYCTDSTLYVCSGRWDDKYKKHISKLMSFDITGEAPEFKASGEFAGSILNTFSIDEYNGYVRVAAQLDGHSCVYVFDGSLKVVGKVDKIAPGESIRAVRFSGNTGYVVTFYQTDPLFVLDLTDPTAPVIVGELKIPGFSSYLHPVGENLLLGVGTGGTEEGTDGSAKLSLFDVSDPKKPKEIDTLILKNADFNTGYKAFVTDASDNTFLVPYDSWQYKTVNEGYVHETVSSQTAGILRVAVESGKIVKKNAYEVTTASNRDIDYYQFSRAAFVGDTVYGIDCWSTNGRVVSFDKTTGEKLSEFVYDSYR